MKKLVYVLVAVVITVSGLLWYKSGMSDPALQGVPQFDKLQIVKTGTASVTYSFPSHAATISGSEESGETIIAHNLGYIPHVLVDISPDPMDPNGIYSPIVHGGIFDIGLSSGVNSITTWGISSDGNDLIIDLTRGFSVTSGTLTAQSGTVAIRYYLLRAAAN